MHYHGSFQLYSMYVRSSENQSNACSSDVCLATFLIPIAMRQWHDLKLIHVYVGFGDTLLVRVNNGYWLIDGGPLD